MRQVSFFYTYQKMWPYVPIQRAKNVTRRLGYWDLELDKPRLKNGEMCWAVEKSQGLKKGEKVHRLWPIRVEAIYREPLNEISPGHVKREGFKGMTPSEFVEMFIDMHKGKGLNRYSKVTVIEFGYPKYTGVDLVMEIPRKCHIEPFELLIAAMKNILRVKNQGDYYD